MRRAPAVVPAVVAAIALVLAAAGCGEKETPTATSDWADSLCTSLNSWTIDMQEVVRQFVTPEDNVTTPGVIQALDRAETATSTLRDDLQNLGRPPLENGQQAKELADESADAMKEHINAAQDAAHGESDTLEELLQRDVTILSELKAASDEARTLVSKLEGAGSQVRNALDQSGACDDLRSELGS